jgi:hypothetical protein
VREKQKTKNNSYARCGSTRLYSQLLRRQRQEPQEMEDSPGEGLARLYLKTTY